MSVQFRLTSEDGLPIPGDLDIPSEPEALVILVHGFKGFKDWGFFPWLARFLAEQHFAVCRFNMSRAGITENRDVFDRLDLFADNTFSAEIADLRTVARYAQEQVKLHAFLFGHSRGGATVLLGADTVSDLRGVITWNALANVDRWDDATRKHWRKQGHLDVENARTKQVMRLSTRLLDDVESNKYDVIAAASQLRVPVLAIAGERDETVPPDESRQLVAAAKEGVHMTIRTGTHTFNATHPMVDPPRELELAAAVTARFVAAESED